MPTGYTAPIADGISFEQFVWTCARGFGALVLLRDDPNAPIPERFEPSTYYSTKAEEVRARIAALDALTGEDLAIAVAAEHEAGMAIWRKHEASKTELRNKYSAMLAKVVQWVPPTPGHQGLKDLMQEQVLQSIDFDCHPSQPPFSVDDPEDWKANQLLTLRRLLAVNEREHVDEIARTEERNTWLKALRDSVPPPAP